MQSFRSLEIALFSLILSACSQPPADEQVRQFLTSPEYEMLSQVDRALWTREQWDKYAESGVVPRPRLSPTSKYFELEQHLYEFASFDIKQVVQGPGNSQTVTVIVRWPEPLVEVGFFSEPALNVFKEEIENLNAVYESGRLTATTIQLSELERELVVLPDGIFYDVAKLQKQQDAANEISQLGYVEDYDLDFDFYTLSSSATLVSQIEDLREIGIDQITKDIASLEAALIRARELNPEIYVYSSLSNLADLHRAKIVLESDIIYDETLTFDRVRIGEAANRRGLGLFFDWILSGDALPHEAVSAGFQARFFDGDGLQIGSEDFLLSSRISVESGNRGGSIGVIIDNQGVAQRASTVEVRYLVPAVAPRYECEFEQVIECNER